MSCISLAADGSEPALVTEAMSAVDNVVGFGADVGSTLEGDAA